jgi:hypothetical protein
LAGFLPRRLSLSFCCLVITLICRFCDRFAGFLGATDDTLSHSLDLPVSVTGDIGAEPFSFVASNTAHWLGSSVIRQWLWVMIIGTFGTVLLRP